MQLTQQSTPGKWAGYMDNTILSGAAALPVGIVIGNAGFEGMVAITGLAWLIRAVIMRENPFSRIAGNPAVAAWGAWIFCIILSVIVNGPGSKGFWHDIAFIRFFLFACALLDLSTRRPIHRYLVWGLAAGVMFAALNTLVCYMAGYDLLGRSLERYTSKLKEPARFAGICAMAFPFFMMWAINVRPEKSRIWKICAVTGVIALLIVLQTTIRTAALASFCGIYAGVFAWRFQKMGWLEKGFWLVFSVSGFWFAATLVSGWDLQSFYDRIAIWKVVMVMWRENMLLGVGVGSFQDAYARIAASGIVPPYVAPDGIAYLELEAIHAHNLFLMLLSSTGVLGLCSFLWLFGCCIVSAVKNTMPWKYGMMTWPVVFLVIGLTGSNIFHSWYQALFSFFAVLALTGRGDQKQSG